MSTAIPPTPSCQSLWDPGEDPHAARYWADLESALMAQAIETASDLPPERRKALLACGPSAPSTLAPQDLPKAFPAAASSNGPRTTSAAITCSTVRSTA